MRRTCAHCQLLPPLNGAGSLCGACWLTAPNDRNTAVHVAECGCWLSRYAADLIERWRNLMTACRKV